MYMKLYRMSRFLWISISVCVITGTLQRVHCAWCWRLCFLLIITSSVLGDQTCTRFGNDLVQAVASQRTGTFVNISSSVSCPGNATRWNICYYNSITDPSSTTYFGVYRLTSGTVYNLVNGSSTKFTIPQNNSAYACSQFPIPQSQQYIVLPGDILVVCVQARVNNGGPGRLGIVASLTGASVLRDSTPCTSLPSSPINIGGGVYNPSSGNTLHVSLGKMYQWMHMYI